MQPKTVLITGFICVGTTTVFNKICNANEKTQMGEYSVTQDASSKQSAYGKGFRLIQAPGTGGDENQVKRACILRKAVSSSPLDQILLVVKYNRINLILHYLKIIETHFARYKGIITVIITYWDCSEQQNELMNKQNIEEAIRKRYQVESFLYHSKNTSGNELCEKIDNIIDKSKTQEIKVFDEEFFTKWISDILLYDEDIFLQPSRTFMSIRRQIINHIENISDNDPQIIQKMQDLALEIKHKALDVLQQYFKKEIITFSKLEVQLGKQAFLLYRDLKGSLSDIIEGIFKIMRIKTKNVSQLNYKNFKQCPHCGEVWIKVTTCMENLTVCGSFPEKDDNQKKLYKDPGIHKRIGCRQQFNWNLLPALPEDLIDQLMGLDLASFYLMQISPIEAQQKEIFLKYCQEIYETIQIREL